MGKLGDIIDYWMWPVLIGSFLLAVGVQLSQPVQAFVVLDGEKTIAARMQP